MINTEKSELTRICQQNRSVSVHHWMGTMLLSLYPVYLQAYRSFEDSASTWIGLLRCCRLLNDWASLALLIFCIFAVYIRQIRLRIYCLPSSRFAADRLTIRFWRIRLFVASSSSCLCWSNLVSSITYTNTDQYLCCSSRLWAPSSFLCVMSIFRFTSLSRFCRKLSARCTFFSMFAVMLFTLYSYCKVLMHLLGWNWYFELFLQCILFFESLNVFSKLVLNFGG